MYTYKIFDSVTEECENIFKDKKNIQYSNFFQNKEYIKQITQSRNSKIKIIVIYDNKTVLAIFPFEIKKIYFIKVLQWIGSEYSDYSNPILSKNYVNSLNKKYFMEVWSLILNEIKNELDLIFFNNQLSHINGLANPFVEFFNTSRFSKIYNINLEKNFEEYKENIKNKDKKHAYEIHRTLIKYKKLKNTLQDLKVEVLESDHNDLDFKKIIDEKKIQLNEKNKKNKLNENFRKIFDNLIKSKQINFYLISLINNNEPLARCFGFKYKNTFYYYIPTVLPNSFNNYKPGKILILELIQWCIKNKIAKFDFGLGSEKYKKYFSNTEISLHRYYNFYTFRGLLAYTFMLMIFQIKKFWL